MAAFMYAGGIVVAAGLWAGAVAWLCTWEGWYRDD